MEKTSQSKRCTKCGSVKPMTDFYKHPAMKDGVISACKECTKAAVRANRLKRIDYYRAYDMKRSKLPDRQKAATEIISMWRKADKRRSACHNAVSRAIRAGEITRMPCERCGSEKSLAHHESYDRKLDVTWLCQPCHKQRHKEMAIEGIDP